MWSQSGSDSGLYALVPPIAAGETVGIVLVVLAGICILAYIGLDDLLFIFLVLLPLLLLISGVGMLITSC